MMQLSRRILSCAALGAAISVLPLPSAQAQNRLTLPAGSVILVRTQAQLQSSSVRQGQTFDTIVEDSVGLENYTVIPRGSHIRGTVTYVQPATRSQSGVIEVDFNSLTLPDGTSYPIQGRLTSTDAEERRQIEQSSDQRVVLVGGRGGIGAAIAGAGSQNSSTSGILGALGALLSEGRDVSVPAGTTLAVQLEQALSLRARGLRRAMNDATLFTSADMIRAAQQELARQNYYRGTSDGQLTYATQRAIFEYQVDKGLNRTGNLDWRTVRSLGLTGIVGNGGTTAGGNYLTATQASTLRRDAQTLAARQRQDLSVSSVGRLSSTSYGDADLDLWFALSAFADNASLYEQIIRSSNTNQTMTAANRALLNAARRVDTALSSSRASNTVRNSWSTIRSRLTGLDSTYY
ncbi:MAG TPA: peptidoglycan-binding domain-containing protein [Gemmatimonadaceae bacterium]|nr:peptidoglycan-binding domain-containing protein [Gemmatimonadaceae bacterium]